MARWISFDKDWPVLYNFTATTDTDAVYTSQSIVKVHAVILER